MAKKIALWNPYLDIVGGGEKHVLQICSYFAKRGYELHIFWDQDLKDEIESKLSMSLPSITWHPRLTTYSFSKRLTLLKDFDILVYVTDGSYFLSTAKKTICFCMVPDDKLYKMGFLERIYTFPWKFICNSQFTKNYLENWGVKADVVYPIVESQKLPSTKSFSGTSLTFLTVGRFFKHLHSKRHDAAVAWFVSFIAKYPQFSTSKLVLVGGLKSEDQGYYESLKKLSKNYANIIFKTNISSSDLMRWYQKADFYLHFAGWQVNESKHPERTEHLGITPIEAMSHGCIPFCYLSGGIREVVQDNQNGFTFKSLDELTQKVLDAHANSQLQQTIRENALNTVSNRFSEDALNTSMFDLFHNLV